VCGCRSEAENQELFALQRIHGNKWAAIAKGLGGRTENGVKNRFNSSGFKKWATAQGVTLEGTCTRKKPQTLGFKYPLTAAAAGLSALPPGSPKPAAAGGPKAPGAEAASAAGGPAAAGSAGPLGSTAEDQARTSTAEL